MRTRTRPTPAERARTVLAGATSVRLGVLELAHEVERHVVAEDGALLLQPSADSPARVLACGGSMSAWTGTAVAIDVAGIAHHDRIRGRVTLTGPVEAIPEPMATHVGRHLAEACPSVIPVAGPLLRLTPQRVVLEWRCAEGDRSPARAVKVPVGAFAAATPDPFAGCAEEWLAHLDRAHPRRLRALAEHVSGSLADDARARPLLVDRYGLVLRITGAAATSYDVRIPFAQPVACPCEGADAVEELWSRLGSS